LIQYEAMFLFDPTFGSAFENCEAEVRRLMERAQAEILFCRRWDERRLAYKVKGRKRGVYALVYFTAPPDKIAGLQRDAQIAENILRLLVTRADHMTPELMEKAAVSRGEDAAAAVAADSPPGRRGPMIDIGDIDLSFDEPKPRGRRAGAATRAKV